MRLNILKFEFVQKRGSIRKMKSSDLHNKTLFLILSLEDEEDHHVTTGNMIFQDGSLYFRNDSGADFPLPEDTLERIQEATPELKSSEGADFYLVLYGAPLTDNMDKEELFLQE